MITMLATIRLVAFLLTLGAPVNALIANSAGMQRDSITWLAVALIAASAFAWANHEHRRREAHRAEREASQRLQMAAYRHNVWAERDRRVGRA